MQLQDEDASLAVLRNRRGVDRLLRLRHVVVLVLYLHQDLYGGAERHRAAVAGHHTEPVMWLGLPVQDAVCADDPCKKDTTKGSEPELEHQKEWLKGNSLGVNALHDTNRKSAQIRP